MSRELELMVAYGMPADRRAEERYFDRGARPAHGESHRAHSRGTGRRPDRRRGGPVRENSALRRVKLVMKDGRVYR